MDDTLLAGLEHENMIATSALAAELMPDALIRRRDGVALLATGLPLRLFNQILVEGPGATAAAISSAVAETRARGDRFVVNLRVGTDDALLPHVAALGLVPLSAEPWMPGMALHPIPEPAAPDAGSGFVIRRATDAAGFEDHLVTAAAGFGMDMAVVRRFMSPALLSRPEAAIYVGYLDGTPVSTGLGIRTGRTIGVYNIATLETARGHGYGAAMTRRVAADGAAAGCNVAILQASDMGLPIYERLGYRTVVEYMGYIDPQPDEDASPAG